jgi:TPR repeat protein
MPCTITTDGQSRETAMHRIILFAALLSIASPAFADFDSGCAAFDRGDPAAAHAQWEPLAEQGHAKAQFRLGCLYVFGQGVPQDYQMALRLFRLAAEQGDIDAQNNLGGMYAEGLGVGRDLVQAYMWFELAAAKGHDVAIRNRAFISKELSAEEVDRAKAAAAEWRARHPSNE